MKLPFEKTVKFSLLSDLNVDECLYRLGVSLRPGQGKVKRLKRVSKYVSVWVEAQGNRVCIRRDVLTGPNAVIARASRSFKGTLTKRNGSSRLAGEYSLDASGRWSLCFQLVIMPVIGLCLLAAGAVLLRLGHRYANESLSWGIALFITSLIAATMIPSYRRAVSREADEIRQFLERTLEAK